METKYSCIIYSCLIFGSGILCDRKLERLQAVSSSLGYRNIRNTEVKFSCSYGVSIETSKVCDGHKDCSDGSDETKEMCSRTEYKTNITTDCGRVYINQGRIDNGQRALEGTAPWNVGIYRFNKISSEYELNCGGSIISSNLVVSAAICFWRPDMLSRRILTTNGIYKIAVGKYDKNISIIDNEFTQIMDVEIIYLKESFNGIKEFYAEDIAIVVLKNRVSFSRNVAPICIDWDGKYNVVNGDQGKVVGWGYPSNNSLSPTLLELSLPYIDHTSCQNMYTNEFNVYVTLDKFCAGSALVSGEGVVKGYAGAALSFLHNNSYYLTGVTSVKDAYSNNSISAFTEVKYHIQWIRELYDHHK